MAVFVRYCFRVNHNLNSDKYQVPLIEFQMRNAKYRYFGNVMKYGILKTSRFRKLFVEFVLSYCISSLFVIHELISLSKTSLYLVSYSALLSYILYQCDRQTGALQSFNSISTII